MYVCAPIRPTPLIVPYKAFTKQIKFSFGVGSESKVSLVAGPCFFGNFEIFVALRCILRKPSSVPVQNYRNELYTKHLEGRCFENYHPLAPPPPIPCK